MPDHLYVSVEEVKEQLTLTGTSYADSEVQDAVLAACLGIDNMCRRRFWLDPEPGEDEDLPVRRYTPEWPHLVEIDDLSAEAAITVKLRDAELVAGTDYLLEPLNAPLDGWPYRYVRLLKPPAGRADTLHGVLSVEGRFGWPEVPANVRTFAKILAAKLVIRMRNAPLGFQMQGIDQATVARIARTDPDIPWLLGVYIIQRFQSVQLG